SSKFILLFSFIAICTILIIFIFTSNAEKKHTKKSVSWNAMLLGMVGLIFAGAPFWVANLPIEIGFTNYSRFSIPAALGSAFLIYGVITLLKRGAFANILLSIFCGSAVMMHLLSGNYFRNVWILENRFIWQLAWRIPAVDPGTTFFSNELPLPTIGENTVSAAINWIYMESSFPVDHIDYYLYYDKNRFINEFPDEKDIPFEKSHMAGVFSGNSSNLITFWYQPSACLHIINEKWDRYNPDIPLCLRKTAQEYPNKFIRSQGNSETNIKESPIFLNEPLNSFCYFYQKADLAAENRNWDEVINLWDTTLNENLKPNHALERLPFIQGLAHTNKYRDSFALSLEIMDISKEYEPVLCDFWKELSQDKSLDKKIINEFIEENLSCYEMHP
ncbi:MAG: hypothetical protein J7K66_01475, partial [Anaerolineaceae bacterium]|nr:hypothetical protein [Anaerolineaceae bacterium]